jgi:DNA-binding NarL/FixJ family response regulator
MNQPKNNIRVGIADPQYLITESLRSILRELPEFSCVGEATSLTELNQLLAREHPDILITDCYALDMSGPGFLSPLLSAEAGMSVMVLTHAVTRKQITELSQTGVRIVLLKTASREEVVAALQAAAMHRKYYPEELLNLLTEADAPPSLREPDVLTPSEMAIVQLIASGLTTKEIALRKHLSTHTVMTHRKNIFRKLNINNASELVVKAIRNGWIDPIEYYI